MLYRADRSGDLSLHNQRSVFRENTCTTGFVALYRFAKGMFYGKTCLKVVVTLYNVGEGLLTFPRRQGVDLALSNSGDVVGFFREGSRRRRLHHERYALPRGFIPTQSKVGFSGKSLFNVFCNVVPFREREVLRKKTCLKVVVTLYNVGEGLLTFPRRQGVGLAPPTFGDVVGFFREGSRRRRLHHERYVLPRGFIPARSNLCFAG